MEINEFEYSDRGIIRAERRRVLRGNIDALACMDRDRAKQQNKQNGQEYSSHDDLPGKSELLTWQDSEDFLRDPDTSVFDPRFPA
ncbi:MAG: hypothetical protein OEW15_08155 [Nitrospirota bacterium]|nr:hypothetical protein [Nitrospirota bacterium]